VPLRQRRFTRAPNPDRCLFVLLPGYGADPEDFVERGFVRELEENVDGDVIVVDAHLGYYVEQTILVRLEEDVIEPARAEGYEHVWLIGFSMGALGALGYGATHADEVEGIVVVSPWLGLGFLPGGVEGEIESHGGLSAWRATLEDDSELNGAAHVSPDGSQEAFFRLIWGWAADPRRPDGTHVPIHVGYGRQERWAPSQRLLADSVPERRRLVGGGVHGWGVFYDLWRGFLWQGFMQRSCGRARAHSSR
jgi:pimeloyl-ACP methyl ester carboxylesterase